MIRCSRLNDAEHCGLSATVEDKATNVYAMRGDAFHAVAACHYRPKEARFREARAVAMGLLDEASRAEVVELVSRLTSQWTPPEDARFESPIGLSLRATALTYGSGEAITEGTADVEWVEDDTMVVLDFKSGARAEWNVPIPRDNLQYGGYGFAFADLRGLSKMRLGTYLAHEAKFLWDEVDLDSAEGTKLWERVRGAALRDPEEAVVGPHCADCWVRLRCRAHLLPILSTAERALAFEPLGLGGEEPIAPHRLMRMLQASQAAEAIAERAKDFMKAYVAKHGPVVVDGKQWGPIPVKGKESTSVKALKDAGLYDRAVAVGAVKVGGPTLQHRWTKAKHEHVAPVRTVEESQAPAVGPAPAAVAAGDEWTAPWVTR